MREPQSDAEREAIDHAAYRQLIYTLAPRDADAYTNVIEATHDVIERQQQLERDVEMLEQRLDRLENTEEVTRL